MGPGRDAQVGRTLELAAPLSLASVRPVHCDWSQSTWPCAHFSISGKAPPCRCQRNAFFRGGRLARSQCSLLKKEKRLREEFQRAKALSKRGELRFPPDFTATLCLDPHSYPRNSTSEKSPQLDRVRSLWTQMASPQNLFARTKMVFTYSISSSRTVSSLGEP